MDRKIVIRMSEDNYKRLRQIASLSFEVQSIKGEYPFTQVAEYIDKVLVNIAGLKWKDIEVMEEEE